ncbi:hypothetical protein GCM10020331_087250 [Ectobacillus funiculus]
MANEAQTQIMNDLVIDRNEDFIAKSEQLKARASKRNGKAAKTL